MRGSREVQEKDPDAGVRLGKEEQQFLNKKTLHQNSDAERSRASGAGVRRPWSGAQTDLEP